MFPFVDVSTHDAGREYAADPRANGRMGNPITDKTGVEYIRSYAPL